MSRRVRRVVGAVAVAMWVGGPLAAQPCTGPANAVRVLGAVERPLTVTASDLQAMARTSVTAVDHEGGTGHWEGVTLRSLLDRAGVPGGADLEGHLSGYVVVEAPDGYRATFALAELDGGYWEQLPLLADRRDGEPLGVHAAPFQVIVPDAPEHGRWVRQVACLRVAYPD